MAAPTIPNGKSQFSTTLYEGNGGGQRVGQFVPFTDNGTIANSCIFNDGDSAYLTRTPSSSGSATTFTISAWVKFGALGTSQELFGNSPSGSASSILTVLHYTDNTIYIQGFTNSGSYTMNLQTSRTFEDTSKWYHILIAFDTTQSTSTDRVKMYIDGTLQSMAQTTYPSQNENFGTNQSGIPCTIGRYNFDATRYFDGYFAEVNMVDGQALTPASFGLTDTSTGRWIPKTVSPYPTTTTDIAVTVVSSGGNKYALDGVTQGTVTLIEGATYKFDQSDSSNSGHPLRFSTTSDGTHGGGSEFTSGVTTVGTPGSSGAYTEITVPTGTATLYYYCTNHSGMGGTANTQDQYGTNGFRLKFQDSSALGDDTSGNGNDFTATNLASTDQTTDSPTQNFSTLEGSSSGSMTLSEGNLRYTTASASNWESVYNDKSISSGKWYFELTCKVTTAYDAQPGVILESLLNTNKNQLMGYTDGSVGYNMDGAANTLYYGNSGNNYVQHTGTAIDATDIVGVAYDADTGSMWFAKNNTWVNNGTGVGNPSTGANPTWVQGSFAGQRVRFGFSTYNASASYEVNFGQKSFTYTPPTGFKKLQQDNLPETAKGISGLVWIKDRDATKNHNLFDSSRGIQKELRSNSTDEQFTNADTLNRFLVGGCQIEDGTSVNNSGDSFVSWNWVANSGTTSSNTDGSITSTVQANTTAGFSIVQYTGNATGGATIGHGLSSAVKCVVCKPLSATGSWNLWQQGMGEDYYIAWDSTNAQANDVQLWDSSGFTSSVFTIGSNTTYNNASSVNYVAYCWHEVDGFSKFGKYEGNNSADGTFVYLGFKPAFVMIKSIDNGSSSYPWAIYDNRRSPTNPVSLFLSANDTVVDNTLDRIDFLSNGFKLRQSYSYSNAGETYIYMAFAEHPFVGDGTSPVTAR